MSHSHSHGIEFRPRKGTAGEKANLRRCRPRASRVTEDETGGVHGEARKGKREAKKLSREDNETIASLKEISLG